jgi:amidohydrolase
LRRISRVVALVLMGSAASMSSSAADIGPLVDLENPKVIAWRRDIHEHPELSNREFRTSKLVAEHLKHLGLSVDASFGRTGIVALLRGAKPGPMLALRADMDALPLTEQTQLPFMSHAKALYRGQSVGVMHACGHDSHTAMLMGAAEILVGLRGELNGSVLFIFQPAEEGPPEGEEGGAKLMLQQGLFEKYRPDAAVALHVSAALPVGHVGFRSGPELAAGDDFEILVHGVSTHGARPWEGVDPIVVAAQIVGALQTIVSRQTDLTAAPAVISIGTINGGVRDNVIADRVQMLGTVRSFGEAQRKDILDRMRRIVADTAHASGATASLDFKPGNSPVVYNDPALTRRMSAVLTGIAGAANTHELPFVTGSEDFGHFAQQVPGFYFVLGVTPPGKNPATAPSNHSPLFFLDEDGMSLGVHALAQLALSYLSAAPAP